MELTTEFPMDKEDHQWLVREAKLRGMRHEDLFRQLINLVGVRVIPGSQQAIKKQLDDIAREAIKRGRQASIARDC